MLSIWKRLKQQPVKQDPQQEKERREEIEKLKLTWKDKFAMVFSAYVVIFIPAVVILLLLVLLCLWLFKAL